MGTYEMAVGELNKAKREYDLKMISKEVYEIRVMDCIYEIYKCGRKEDAERIAVAHGYKLKDIINKY